MGSDDDYGYNEDTAPSQSTGDGAAVNNLKLQAINYLTEANTSLSSWHTRLSRLSSLDTINVKKTKFIYKCYRLTHRKQQKLEL